MLLSAVSRSNPSTSSLDSFTPNAVQSSLVHTSSGDNFLRQNPNQEDNDDESNMNGKFNLILRVPTSNISHEVPPSILGQGRSKSNIHNSIGERGRGKSIRILHDNEGHNLLYEI